MSKNDNSDPDTAETLDGRDSPQASIPRGTKFARYIIIHLLGAGGMGSVYRAYDPALNRGLALKILSVRHRDVKVADRAKVRLLREAQALAKLSHPNVVTVHDAGSVGDDVFVAMTLVEGQTLAEWMKENPTCNQTNNRHWQKILKVMIAAGQGLAAAHKAVITHRDFKPSNVMVGQDGRVSVLDFCLARVDDATPTRESNESEAVYRKLQTNDSS